MHIKITMAVYADWYDLHALCDTECKISINQKKPTQNMDEVLKTVNDHLYLILMNEVNERVKSHDEQSASTSSAS